MMASGAASAPQVCVDLQVLALEPVRAALQRGVRVPARVPCTIAQFLVDQLGIAPETVERRISTLFVDGSVVDSVDGTELRDGSILALSAAMPGLVGATLRRGGYYARMRAEITAAAGPGPAARAGSGVVTVKLFNLLIAELGPHLLAHGILLPRATAAAAAGARALPAGDGEVLVHAAAEGAA